MTDGIGRTIEFLGRGILAFVFVVAMVAQLCTFHCRAAMFIVILIILTTVAPHPLHS